jgi:hypothetical protein
MRGIKALWATVSVIALMAGVSLLPNQAAAQLNIPGAVFGAIHGGFPGNGSYGNSRRARTHESRHSKDAKEDDEPSGHNSSERSSASNSKSGGEQELSAPVKSDPHPPSQTQPQTAASVSTPKSSGEEPSFSPSR